MYDDWHVSGAATQGGGASHLSVVAPDDDTKSSGSVEHPVASSPVSPAASVVSVEQLFRRARAKADSYSPLSQDTFCRSPMETPCRDTDSESKAQLAHVKRKLVLHHGVFEAVPPLRVIDSLRAYVTAAGANPGPEAARHVSWPCLPCTFRSAKSKQHVAKKRLESVVACCRIGACFRCHGRHSRVGCPVYPQLQAMSAPRVSPSHASCVVCGLPNSHHVNLSGQPVSYGRGCNSFAKDVILAGCWSLYRNSAVELLHSPAAKCLSEIEFRDWLLLVPPNSSIPNCVMLVHWALSDLYQLL